MAEYRGAANAATLFAALCEYQGCHSGICAQNRLRKVGFGLYSRSIDNRCKWYGKYARTCQDTKDAPPIAPALWPSIEHECKGYKSTRSSAWLRSSCGV